MTSHPQFKPLVDIHARIYDMAHDPATREVMAGDREVNAIGAAVYNNFQWDAPLSFVKRAAGLSDQILGQKVLASGDSAVNQWFAAKPRQQGNSGLAGTCP